MHSLAMQPPPSRSSPGVASAAGAPPTGATSNAFRRNTPFRRSNTPLSGAPLPPVTDPFGLSRPPHTGDSVAPHSTNNGNLLPPPLPTQQDGNHVPPRWSTDSLHSAQGMFPGSPTAPGERSEPCGAPAPLAPTSRFGDGQFSPASPPAGADAGQGLPNEPSYFHTGLGPEGGELGPHHGSTPSQTRNTHGQEPLPFPPGAPAFQPQLQPSSSSQWVVNHGSRPPSVQNYFQPSDPQTQGLGSYISPQAQLSPFPSHQNQVPGSFSQQQHSSPDSFAQLAGAERQDSGRPAPFHFPPQHQQNFSGPGFTHPENWAPGFLREPCLQQAVRPNGPPSQLSYPPDSDPGTVSMFFKGGEVENKETLASDQQHGAGVATGDNFQSSGGLFLSRQSPPQPSAGQQTVGRASSVEPQGFLPQPASQYGVYSQGSGDPGGVADPTMPQRVSEALAVDNDENSEFVQNQEVLPNEPKRVPLGFQPIPSVVNQGQHVTKNIRPVGGPPPVNQETPDMAPHPLRSDSISSNHSSASHSSGSSLRRCQPPPNTFIQQESGKPPTDGTSSSFFEQIDTSPLARETDSAGRTMYYSQLPQPTNPTPPKPMATFQASANSSFEPVRSHGQLAVKAAEVDQANMVMELNQNAVSTVGQRQGAIVSDTSPGNLEEPPDNMENISIPQTCSNLYPGPVAPENALRALSETPEKRGSLRVHGARAKSESPAATLWAQNELPNFSAGIVLAPAAPAVPAAAKEPCAEVVQPPEDGSKELSFPLLVGNMENPPQALEDGDPKGQVTKDVQQQQQQPMATMTGQQAAPPPSPSTAHDSSLQSGHYPPAGYGYPGSGSAQPAAQHQSVTQAPVTTTGAPQLPSHPEVPLQHPYPPVLPHVGYGYSYPYAYQDYSTDPQQAFAVPYPSYPTLDPRIGQQMSYQPMASRGNHPYYQDDPYRRYNVRYARYDANSVGYKDQERERTSRPSSRASQSSDRPSSRQGYTEDPYGGRGGRESYPGYYADYYSGQYQYRDLAPWERYDLGAYDSRYRDYRDYDRPYWYYGPYQARDPYYREPYGDRRNGYEELWQYDPRYDSSFDESSRRDPYPDEFDRRSTHSEQSAHSVLSSHSVRSRRSSFSSQSQQSQVYRSQQELAVPYEQPSQTTITADYTYGQYSENTVQANYSDYQYGYPAETGWQPVERIPPRPVTPEKFTVPHLCVRFGPGGQLLKVLGNLPSEGQPALVEIHSLETILQQMPEQEELRSFPGPLAKEETHKVDVINFAQTKATECLRNEELLDKESANLLWELIVLLCRQNGTVIGTDIAELLLREHRSVWLPGKSPNEANLIDFNNDLVPRAEDESCTSLLADSFLDSNIVECTSKDTERFRELLLFGRKKDALESAMKHGLWGHALLLASKMDSRTHAKVMTRFANSLPINDPLQTVYQLMSGRMPAAATCCGDEKWGDWRPHLAMVLSNLSNGPDLDRRTITTMGDTLAAKGLLDASHFCYLMAQVGFGVYTRKTTKLVLIGSNHSWPFLKFASNEAIQRTEAYEYAQALGSQTCFLPNFQVFKFIYACRLAEVGLAAQAFHYCEVIARTILRNPAYYSPVLLRQLIQISSQLRFSDPQSKERSEHELHVEPDWIQQLRQMEIQTKDGGFICGSGRATPQPFCSSTPSSEYDPVNHTEELPTGPQEEVTGMENPLMTSFVPDVGSTEVSGVQLMPAAPHTVLDGRMMAAPPSQTVTDGTVPLYSPTHTSPGFPGQSPNSAFRQPCDLSKGPFPGSPAGPPVETLPTVQEQQGIDNAAPPESSSINHQILPKRHSFGESGQLDFYDQMAKMQAPGRRSRSASQSSLHMPYGRRSRTTSESSNHSLGRERNRSASNQPTLPPQPEVVANTALDGKKEPKREQPESKKAKGGWLSWLRSGRKNEAHLPDDKNKSIVWDEKKQRWVNLNEPEEESKPLPPPPSLPVVSHPSSSAPTSTVTGSPPSVNRFSRKAGTKARYVDVLNPSGTQPNGGLPPPVDLFAPLAPMPIPTNLFVPMPGEGPQPPEGSPAETSQSVEQTNSEANSQAQVPPPAQGGSSQGTVQFYNPAQFAQPTASTAASRTGRFGQRKYPTLK
ncbi:protein transport protein Sec16A isoform X5 [Mobula birostris]|uniref:protein transport protein Sec16A isoform X5 n=1 Tax=Mobula birostris TaxID=1983395 RepID=UPI003B27F86C